MSVVRLILNKENVLIIPISRMQGKNSTSRLTFTTQSRFSITLKNKTLEKTVGKGEGAGNQHFLLSHSVLYSIEDRNCHFGNV